MSEAQRIEASALVVDDGEANRRILSGILSARGYRVRTASGGEDALLIAQSEHFDIVLLDINMPDMDGYEACRELKADPRTQAVPVIFISALDDPMDKVKAFDAGGSDYIVKPFQSAEVLARVENQLKLARLQRELERQNQELTRKNDEILRATEELKGTYREVEAVFSALSFVLPGKVLDEKYRLESLIGSGGFGAVYRANHLRLNRPVAIKVLRPTAKPAPEDAERFRMEGIFACRVNHPNAIAVWDSGVTKEGIAYLVMELLTGRTLREELSERGCLPLSRCAEIIAVVCGVLEVAHATGVVHRDIKPDNVFLHQDRAGEVVKVVDFGIATLLFDEAFFGSRLHTPGAPVGTPAYVAPERFLMKPYDGRADIYSVGVMLYEMLCGEVPFGPHDAASFSVAHKHLTEQPARPSELCPSIPPAVEALILQALEKDPAKRPTAAELAARFSDAHREVLK
jgi:DNA-binding response OmpR family regulator